MARHVAPCVAGRCRAMPNFLRRAFSRRWFFCVFEGQSFDRAEDDTKLALEVTVAVAPALQFGEGLCHRGAAQFFVGDHFTEVAVAAALFAVDGERDGAPFTGLADDV